VSQVRRIRRQQLLREAEGYMELILALDDRFPLSPAVRDRVAERVLSTLDQVADPGAFRGDVLYLRGQALRAMQRCAEAVGPLREAAEEDPGNVNIWLALGWCHKRTGRLDLAIQALEEGLAVDASQAVVHYNLACYWSLARNVGLSVKYLSQAFDLDAGFRELVPREADFDPIRGQPEFQAITAVIV
jgi:tetratricopeptide (TPR) repeat protein